MIIKVGNLPKVPKWMVKGIVPLFIFCTDDFNLGVTIQWTRHCGYARMGYTWSFCSRVFYVSMQKYILLYKYLIR